MILTLSYYISLCFPDNRGLHAFIHLHVTEPPVWVPGPVLNTTDTIPPVRRFNRRLQFKALNVTMVLSQVKTQSEWRKASWRKFRTKHVAQNKGQWAWLECSRENSRSAKVGGGSVEFCDFSMARICRVERWNNAKQGGRSRQNLEGSLMPNFRLYSEDSGGAQLVWLSG